VKTKDAPPLLDLLKNARKLLCCMIVAAVLWLTSVSYQWCASACVYFGLPTPESNAVDDSDAKEEEQK